MGEKNVARAMGRAPGKKAQIRKLSENALRDLNRPLEVAYCKTALARWVIKGVGRSPVAVPQRLHSVGNPPINTGCPLTEHLLDRGVGKRTNLFCGYPAVPLLGELGGEDRKWRFVHSQRVQRST